MENIAIIGAGMTGLSLAYNLQNKNEISLAKDETSNNIVRRGLIEKIFGGVGPQQLPTSP